MQRRYPGASGLDARFAASLTLTGRLTAPHAGQLRAEVGDAVERFWGGAPLPTPQLRRWLKAAGEPPPQLGAVGVQELARQRLDFLPRLFQAAGWAGWVLLIDEVELIGRYPPLSRGRSYAAVADLLAAPRHDPTLALLPVLALTDDYEAAVLTGKDDRTTIPARLRAQQRPDSEQAAHAATAGMRALTRDLVLLTPPDDEELDRAYSALRDLHGRAFAWTPPHVPGLERLQATRMRQHVRAWINEWDLARLDPTYTPVTLATPIATQYDEDAELDATSP